MTAISSPAVFSPAGPARAAAIAHPNIALVKYWGKRDVALNLPAVGSISITLDTLETRTRVEFLPDLEQDHIELNGKFLPQGDARISACLDLLRQRAGCSWSARVESRNNFPTAAGLASSASGFAALVHAANHALGLELSGMEQSIFARQGSGSAARSIFGGFVEWRRGERSDGLDSTAFPLMEAHHWPLRTVIAVTSTVAKAVRSTRGMQHTAETSPFYPVWVEQQAQDLETARAAILQRDFEALARVSEYSCLKMHATMQASRPGLMYWNGTTVEAMQVVRELRQNGTACFFTIDAGPQIKTLCTPEAQAEVAAALRSLPGVVQVIECGPGEGVRLLPEDRLDPKS